LKGGATNVCSGDNGVGLAMACRRAGVRCTEQRFRQARNQADYDIDQPQHQPTSLGQVRLGESIIQVLEAVAADPAVRARVTDAMKAYERDVLGQVTWHP
jgi:hypothetical protein